MSDQHRTVIASDHRGHDVVDAIHDHLTDAGFSVDILARPDDLEAAVDYPDAARAVTSAIVEGRADCGVLICGSGIGMSMAANRVQGVRAALVGDAHAAEMSRRHNDANVLCMGSARLGLCDERDSRCLAVHRVRGWTPCPSCREDRCDGILLLDLLSGRGGQSGQQRADDFTRLG